MSIGRNIRVFRAVRGLTGAELARQAGITANYVSLIEADKRKPSLRRLEAIGEALGVRPELLLAEGAARVEGSEGEQFRADVMRILADIAAHVEALGELNRERGKGDSGDTSVPTARRGRTRRTSRSPR